MKIHRPLLCLPTWLLISVFCGAQSQAQTFTWARGVAGSFSWNNDANVGSTNGNNWGATPSGAFPNAAGVVANLGNAAGANVSTISLGQDITIGSISNIGSTNGAGARTVAPGGDFSLIFDNGSSNASIAKLSGSSASTISAPLRIAGNGILSMSNASSTTLTLSGGIASGLVSGTQKLLHTGGTVTVSGAIANGGSGGAVEVEVSNGNLVLSAANAYTGVTTITGGTLTLSGTAGALATSSAISNSGTFAITRTNAVVQGTDFSGAALTGSGGLSATGTGLVLTLNTANNYAGTTLIGASANNSVVRATASGALGSGAIQFDFTGNATTSRLELEGGVSLSNPSIQLTGRNNSSVAIQSISGDNTLSGDINLQAGGGTYIAQSDAGTLTLAGNIGNASGTGTRTFTAAGGGSILITGGIQNGTGTTALTKTGAGSLTLSGSNTYTGATLVSAGTLFVNGSLANTAVIVSSGASIGGTGTLGGSLSLDASATLTIVDMNDPLAVAGTVTFGSGFGIANLAGIDWDSLGMFSSHSILSTGQVFSESDIANFGVANAVAVGSMGRLAYFDNGSLAVVVIPEPSAALLGGLGLLALLRRRRG